MPTSSGSLDLLPEELRGRLLIWLLVRVFVVTVFLGAFALSHISDEASSSYPLRSTAGLIVTAYALSVAAAYAVGRTSRGLLRRFAFAQVVVEIGLISGAVLLTGGINSPMGVWYNLAIIGASFLLGRHGGYLAASLSSLSYGMVLNLSYYQALPIWVPGLAVVEPGFGILYNVASNIFSFFSIAFLSSILAERRAAAEQALVESETNFQRIETLQRTLVQNLESGVITTDADGVIRSANQAAERIVGKGAVDLVGQMISDLFPVLRPPVGAKRVLDPSPIPIELVHRSAPVAAEQILRCTSFRLSDTYQNLIGSLYIFQDITPLKTLEAERAAEQVAELASQVPTKAARIDGMLGHSPQMIEVADLIEKVAPSEATVLITGESGTGKEVAARAIHSLSARRDKPMVVVNCAAIPENLIETELFGHTRGAFTGAVSDRKGLFRSADGGTIFLDEVGDLPLLLQVKLLRVLQERAFTPVGAQAQIVVDVRIIAATNRDLETDVANGRFREDLFYRLNVIRLRMPSLRERTADLPLLIEHFLDRFSEALERPRPRLSTGALNRLVAYPYPGNIRELENIVQRLVALTEGEVVGEGEIPGNLGYGGVASPKAEVQREPVTTPPAEATAWMDAGSSNLDDELEAVERKLLDEALRRSGGVRKRAAEILGINYRSLRHRLSKYGYGDVDGREARD